MTATELQQEYLKVFGEETKSRNKEHLVKKIAWQIQAQKEGGLSERALRRAEELAKDALIRTTPPKDWVKQQNEQIVPIKLNHDKRLPKTGSSLTRKYKGRVIRVEVLGNGFEYEGEVYKSLSAVARVITGTHLNGYHFFKLTGS